MFNVVVRRRKEAGAADRKMVGARERSQIGELSSLGRTEKEWIPKWNDVYGGSQSAAQKSATRLRRAAAPPMSTHDARVATLCRRLKKALIELQEETELDILNFRVGGTTQEMT